MGVNLQLFNLKILISCLWDETYVYIFFNSKFLQIYYKGNKSCWKRNQNCFIISVIAITNRKLYIYKCTIKKCLFFLLKLIFKKCGIYRVFKKDGANFKKWQSTLQLRIFVYETRSQSIIYSDENTSDKKIYLTRPTLSGLGIKTSNK